jgi:hypothetical protein
MRIGLSSRSSTMVANLTAWIVGVLLLGAAGTSFARLCVRRRPVAWIALLRVNHESAR